MRLIALLLLCISLPSMELADALVKLRVTTANPDYNLPYASKRPSGGTGSGFVVAGQRILTAAHVVANATWLQLQRPGESKWWTARVVAAIHDADLAVVEPEDPAFFEGSVALELAPLPELHSVVTAWGFPSGGDGLSITEGVVSRIGYVRYVHSGWQLLAVQIDAAINPGNSGGPVMQNGRVVGIAMQGSPTADNIGYIVPTTVIEQALKDLEDGTFDGFPGAGIRGQLTESPTLRAAKGLSEEDGGVLITGVAERSSLAAVLQPGDILLAIDGTPIAADGTIAYADHVRITSNHLFTSRQLGDEITLTYLRGGERLQGTAVLDRPLADFQLVPRAVYDQDPRYAVIGGFVIMPLSYDYLSMWGGSWRGKVPSALVAAWDSDDYPTNAREEIVIVHRVLADEFNQGYHSLGRAIITAVNGIPVRNLAHLVAEIDSSESAYIRLDLEGSQQVFMERAALAAADERIAQRYRVRSFRSADLVPATAD